MCVVVEFCGGGEEGEIKDKRFFKNLLTRARVLRLDLQGARLHLFAVCEFFFSGSFSTSKYVTVYSKVEAQLLVLREHFWQRWEAPSPSDSRRHA